MIDEKNLKRIDELIVKTDYLATMYAYDWQDNDGKEIIETFKEYFSLVQYDLMVHKRVIANAVWIMSVYDREEAHINPSVSRSASEMYLWLEGFMVNWGPRAIEKIDSREQEMPDSFEEAYPWMKDDWDQYKYPYVTPSTPNIGIIPCSTDDHIFF